MQAIPDDSMYPSSLEVLHSIDTERDYQMLKWGPDGASGVHSTHTVGDFILYAMDYCDEGIAQCVNARHLDAVHTLRKVTALIVACLERHNAGGNRRMVYDVMSDVGNSSFSQFPNLQYWLECLQAYLRHARNKQTRDIGDESSLRILVEVSVLAFSIMRTFGAPLRQLPESALSM